MTRITVSVDGMMCGMCEAHVNDAIRRALPAKKVTSSHKRKETVIITAQDIDDSRIRAVVEESGYTCLSIRREAEMPRGLTALFKR